ncbi:MAG TPA: hypothetical protein VM935_10165, partial [Chitinophagaceae bacterium]|nr:hypothetical protein [Chitinophagaceae bacterium]
MKNDTMKLLAFCLLSMFCFTANSQTFTKYYDSDWAPAEKANAAYYADFVKDGELYQCTSYYLGAGKLRGKTMYPDTVMTTPRGLQMLYNKNGNVEDSSFFDASGKLAYSYHYHPNKKLAAHYYKAADDKDFIVEGFDEEGKKIKKYIFQQEASFKGGEKKWVDFLGKKLSTKFTSNTGQEKTVQLRVMFIVNESGQVTKPKILESSGI